jgi:hypothetical protein
MYVSVCGVEESLLFLKFCVTREIKAKNKKKASPNNKKKNVFSISKQAIKARFGILSAEGGRRVYIV